MIGFRGCGRYTDPFFEECFAMELEVWDDQMAMGAWTIFFEATPIAGWFISGKIPI